MSANVLILVDGLDDADEGILDVKLGLRLHFLRGFHQPLLPDLCIILVS